LTGHLVGVCLSLLGMASIRMRGGLELLLMGVLSHGPAHGYAIITTLRDRTDGGFTHAEGTIYPALHRLERAGLVSSATESAQGRRRRVYALTGRGRKEFAAQHRDWQEFVANVQAVLA
jgi:PadR family transcriptional regulator, regulatory protein PadR